MQPFDSISMLERAAVLDAIAGPVRSLVSKVLPNRTVRDVLHGTWLGHPAHPMIVQVPIGSWVCAGFLDCAFVPPKPAAFLTGLGIVTAVPAAAAGLADWSELHPEQQRVGLVHAGANLVALGFEIASLLDRVRGRRTRGTRSRTGAATCPGRCTRVGSRRGRTVCAWSAPGTPAPSGCATAVVVHGPATAPAPVFQVRVRDGGVEVRLPGAG